MTHTAAESVRDVLDALQLAGRGAPTPVVGALARAALRAGTR